MTRDEAIRSFLRTWQRLPSQLEIADMLKIDAVSRSGEPFSSPVAMMTSHLAMPEWRKMMGQDK